MKSGNFSIQLTIIFTVCWINGILCQSDTLLSGWKPDTIRIKNGSFEGQSKMGGDGAFELEDWQDIGSVWYPHMTPPDIHPDGIWDVHIKPYDGNTYLGMVVRDNNTRESVMQELEKPLLPGRSYKMSLIMMRSPVYHSKSITTRSDENFQTPIHLAIWVPHQDSVFMLAKSPLVTNDKWSKYTFIFSTKWPVNKIILEAYHEKGVNGHILIDNLSPIVEIKETDFVLPESLHYDK